MLIRQQVSMPLPLSVLALFGGMLIVPQRTDADVAKTTHLDESTGVEISYRDATTRLVEYVENSIKIVLSERLDGKVEEAKESDKPGKSDKPDEETAEEGEESAELELPEEEVPLPQVVLPPFEPESYFFRAVEERAWSMHPDRAWNYRPRPFSYRPTRYRPYTPKLDWTYHPKRDWTYHRQ